MTTAKKTTTTKSKMLGDDSRVSRSPAAAMRGSREEADADRKQDGTALSSEERRALLREDLVQEVLPTPPDIPGFHCCWLTTTNPSDPIYRRTKLGYTPVKNTEVKGFDFYAQKGGDYDGCIVCNEMILFKLPLQTYNDLMTIYHHDMPNEEERAIVEKLRAAEVTDSSGKPLSTLEQGFQELGKSPQPSFET